MIHRALLVGAMFAGAIGTAIDENPRHKKAIIGLVLLILVSYAACLMYRLYKCEHVESFSQVRGGNNMYMVHEDLKNPELAAETMDRLNSVATEFISRLHEKYIAKDGLTKIRPQYQKIVREGTISLKKNFRTANMQENIPSRSGGDTSYVINKGEVFAMCLRDPNNGNEVDNKFNTLKFVLFHELSHLFSSTFGHGELFWNNFRFVLQEAIDMGLYEETDYRQNKSPYCGIDVTYSPLFDSRLSNYRL